MRYKFVSKRKWINEGIKSIFQVLTIIFISGYTILSFEISDFTNIMLSIIVLVFVFVRVNSAVYYFNLPKKDYIILENSSLSLYRGNLFSRKLISFHQVERVVQISDTIIFRLNDGKEEQIYTEWISTEDSLELKKELKHRFGKKAIAF